MTACQVRVKGFTRYFWKLRQIGGKCATSLYKYKNQSNFERGTARCICASRNLTNRIYNEAQLVDLMDTYIRREDDELADDLDGDGQRCRQ